MLLRFSSPKKRSETKPAFLSSFVVAGYGFRPLELDG